MSNAREYVNSMCMKDCGLFKSTEPGCKDEKWVDCIKFGIIEPRSECVDYVCGGCD